MKGKTNAKRRLVPKSANLGFSTTTKSSANGLTTFAMSIPAYCDLAT